MQWVLLAGYWGLGWYVQWVGLRFFSVNIIIVGNLARKQELTEKDEVISKHTSYQSPI